MSSLFAGVDVGGTHIAAALVSSVGELVTPPIQIPTPSGPDLVPAITHLLGAVEHRANQRAAAVGIGIPGFFDRSNTVLLKAFNIERASNLPLVDQLTKSLDRPVVLVNDASAAAWAEAIVGSGKQWKRVVCLTIGTGVGGGVVMDGHLMREAFEPGHMTVFPNGEECSCGRRGCLEAYVSGRALCRLAESLGSDGGRDHIADAIKLGEAPAIAALHRATDVLGCALASMTLLLGPECFVIGGGVSALGEILIQLTQASFNRHSLRLAGVPDPVLVIAELGNAAGIVGTALLARDRAVSAATESPGQSVSMTSLYGEAI
jgi:glucokinase